MTKHFRSSYADWLPLGQQYYRGYAVLPGELELLSVVQTSDSTAFFPRIMVTDVSEVRRQPDSSKPIRKILRYLEKVNTLIDLEAPPCKWVEVRNKLQHLLESVQQKIPPVSCFQ